MATKKYVWKFDLEEYLMTKDVKEDFAAKVKPIQTFYMADVARLIAEERTEYRIDTIVNITKLVEAKIRQLACGNNIVVTDNVQYSPGIYGGTSSDYTTIAGNAFVIAIDREDDDEVIATTTQIENHTKGLFIRGDQESDGSLVWASSALVGDVTLESDAEIPDWATVTIADNQTFTIADGITLTNNGVLTNKGTLTNNGTFSGLGTVESNTSLNIGGEDGFDVINTDGGATFSYNGTEKLLTISGSDRVLIKGRNKDKAVGCGIVIAQGASPTLTIEDLNIEAAEALVYRGRSDGILVQYNLTLQGTNRLTSTSGGG